jgi:nucleoside-diphosphate-sugar epimerase
MILVVGATGVVGGMITRGLLEQGREVRILVRRDSPSSQLVQQGLATSAEELIASGAHAVHGDLRDRASLDAALELAPIGYGLREGRPSQR